MKKYKAKEKSLYMLLAKNYIIFTLVMALFMFVLHFAETWMEERIIQPPITDKSVGGQELLKAGEYEKLTMKKLLGTSGEFEVLDAMGRVVYAQEEAGTYTAKEIAYIPLYDTQITYKATEYLNDRGEKQILVTGKSLEWDTGFEENESYMILDEDYTVISASNSNLGVQYTQKELNYLTGRGKVGYDICKYDYIGNDGHSYTVIMHVKRMDGQRYRQLKSLWKIFIPVYAFAYVIITVVFTFYMHRKVKAPLELLDKGILSLAEGERNKEITYRGPKEFQTIFGNFNKMSRLLQESEENREQLILEKERMLADISHDLKTPITVIAGYAKAVADNLVDETVQEQYLNTIFQKTESLTELINTFHDYSKLEHPEFQLVKRRQDFGEFLREYLADKYDEIDFAGFTLEAEIPEEVVEYSFDEVQMKRVFDNILSNTLKHNPKGTAIYVTFQHTERMLQVEIGDNGVGIPEEIKEKLFEPFTIGDDSRHNKQGSGLGLAVAAKIVELHGGALFLGKAGNPFISTLFVIKLMK